ncbi:MAG: hypothetical protein RBT34_02825 [Anaerolineaceae bacterium]|nr:hypothetical protein [Anaerolineaceae bacterium]
MPQRFPATSTRHMLALASKPDQKEFQQLLEIDHRIQNLLMKFNLGVDASFSEGGMAGLKEFTTPAGFARMQEKYAGWSSQGVKVLQLVSCHFLSFDLHSNEEQAQAFTFEKWVFVYAGGREVHTQGSVDGYDLHLVNGEWLVNSVQFYPPE